MNFSSQVKKEILSKTPKDLCCKKAFLAGLIRGNGGILDFESGYGLVFTVSGSEGLSLAKYLLKNLYKYENATIKKHDDKFNKNRKDKNDLFIEREASIFILKDLEILEENNGFFDYRLNVNTALTKNDCDFASFLRGYFLSAGSITIPTEGGSGNTKYHLEIVFSNVVPAMEVSARLNKLGINSRIMRRKETVVLYVKSGEEIKSFLALIKANSSLFQLMDLMIEREAMNNSNRATNCDLGNLNRQLDASTKQIDAINKLKSSGIFSTLKKDLRETAEARLENPAMPLVELAEILRISKSCLNHRLRKLVSIAENL